MPLAKSNIIIKDMSFSFSTKFNTSVGLVVDSEKGELGTAINITNKNYQDKLGDVNKDTGMQTLEQLLSIVSEVKVSRVKKPNMFTASALISIKDTPAIKPYIGLNNIDGFVFPQELSGSATTYKPATKDDFIVGEVTNKSLITTFKNLPVGTYIKVNNTHYKVLKTNEVSKTFDTITFESKVTYAAGDTITLDSGVALTVLKAVTNATTVIVDDNDSVMINDKVGTNKVKSKNVTTFPINQITLDGLINTSAKVQSFQVVDKYVFEDVYKLLVYAKEFGSYANRDLQILVDNVDGYEDDEQVVSIQVFYKGAKRETHIVSMKPTVKDMSGDSLYVMDVINNNSQFIGVVDNVSLNSKPALSNTAIVKRLDNKAYVKDEQIAEKVFLGDTNVIVPDNSKAVLGSEIFIPNEPLNTLPDYMVYGDSDIEGKTYKVIAVDSLTVDGNDYKKLTLDEPYIGDNINENQQFLFVFDPTLNDATNNIINGIKSYNEQKYSTYILDNSKTISIGGVLYSVIDSGVKFLAGGSDGDKATNADRIEALKVFKSPKQLKINAILDGGYSNPQYAKAIAEVARIQGSCHAFINISKDAEKSANYDQAIIAYDNALGFDDRRVSKFIGWENVFSTALRKYVLIPNSTNAFLTQALHSDGMDKYKASAGLIRGVFPTSGRFLRTYTDEELDRYLARRINPFIIREGVAYIWGNETSYKKPSPLQLRSVAVLLIALENIINSSIDYQLFEWNDENTRDLLEKQLKQVIRSEFLDKGALYDFKVSIKDLMTDQDLVDRRLRGFIGIQPTMDIQTIDLYIGVGNRGVELSMA